MKAALYAPLLDRELVSGLNEHHSFTVVERFSDAAISEGASERPGYHALLAAARAKQFKIIVAEDTSRLWRSLPEQWRSVNRLHSITLAGDPSRNAPEL
jgi:DNA invertase Pin-like site-specific DNA recombinase